MPVTGIKKKNKHTASTILVFCRPLIGLATCQGYVRLTEGGMKSTLRVIVLHSNGNFTAKSIRPTEIGKEVGGIFQVLPHTNWTMDASFAPTGYVNEEGWHRGLPRNQWAKFMEEQGFLIGSRGIIGDVLLCTVDGDGKSGDVTAQQRQAVSDYYEQHFRYEPVDAEEESSLDL